MELATILGILAAVAAFAAALKSIPVIWGFLRGVGKFFSGAEMIVQLPDFFETIPPTLSTIESKVDDLSKELKDHMAEEERMRSEEKALVEDLAASVREFANTADAQTISAAEAVFKQSTFMDSIPYYIVNLDFVTGEWVWTWGNSAYINLTGLSEGQAAGGQYWDIVEFSDRDRVAQAALYASGHGISLDVDFVCENVFSHEKTPVRLIAAPLKDRRNKTIAYLGALHVRG